MIDKRISYRVGGASGREYDQVGSRSERDNKQESSGGGDRQEYSAQHYTAPAPKKEVEKDAREEYISEMYTPTKNIVPKEEKVITPSIISRGVDLHQGPTVKEVLTDLREKQQDPDYGQFFRRQPVVEKPKSNFWKGVGNIAMALIPGLLPGKLGTAAKFGTSAYNYSQKKGLVYALANELKKSNTLNTLTRTSNLRTPRKKTINTTPTPREDGDGREEGIMLAKAAPKDVITESVQEFTPEQLKNLQKRYDELQVVIESGEYMGQKLNDIQLSKLADISKQMKAFLVDPESIYG